MNFYPRSPCGERLGTDALRLVATKFLSTLSLRRATSLTLYVEHSNLRFLSTLSLRRATHPGAAGCTPDRYFYPRSPCGERHAAAQKKPRWQHFYPRSPCGERPFECKSPAVNNEISIHALLAESDVSGGSVGELYLSFLSTLSLRRATALAVQFYAMPGNFYPRSPCGERLEQEGEGGTV